MRVWVCGVRGSSPASGAAFTRYGGHTSCVALAHDGEPPSLILDAGTGIRNVSDFFGGGPDLLDGAPYEGAILLGHLHWDHTQGLPFFGAGNDPGAQVELYAPAQGDLEAVLARFMSPPHFPIAPSGLLGSWSFRSLEPGKSDIAGFSVVALEIPHLGGRTFGYRITDGFATIAYLSDHCPTSVGPGPAGLGDYHEAALTLTRGSDLVFHDAQLTDDELAARGRFGHCSSGYAVGLAEVADVHQLLLYHHDPPRTDDQIDEIVSSYRDSVVSVRGAAEGMSFDL